MQNSTSVPCPVGTYKSAISRATTCTACPAGLTTSIVGATTQTDCNIAAPGRRPVVVNQTVVKSEPCPAHTFSPHGRSCLDCPDGLSTRSPGMKSVAGCLAPPGYGYYKDTRGSTNFVKSEGLQPECWCHDQVSHWKLQGVLGSNTQAGKQVMCQQPGAQTCTPVILLLCTHVGAANVFMWALHVDGHA